MTRTIHTPSLQVKRLNHVPARETEKKFLSGRDLFSPLKRQRAENRACLQSPLKIIFDRDKNHSDQFKEWRMPEQPEAYIKAKRHGLL